MTILDTDTDASPRRRRTRRWLALAVASLVAGSLLTAADLTAGGSPDGASAAVSLRTYQETDPSISYSGAWRTVSAVLDNGQQSRYLNSAGSAKLTFTGSAVSWVSRTSPTSGKNNVYIDGVLAQTVNQYSDALNFNVPVFTKTWPSSGTHTIELRWTGMLTPDFETSSLLLDAFVVATGTATTPPPVTVPASGTGAASLGVTGVTDAGVALSWAAATTSPSAYEVKRSTDGTSFTTIAKVSSGARSYFDISVRPGVRTHYRVAALNSSGAVTSTSASVSAVPMAISAGTTHRYTSCPAATVEVGTSAALKSALWNARAGSVIRLKPGTYTGSFSAYSSGTAEKPIWVCGPRSAVITTGSSLSGHAFSIEGRHDIILAGMTIRNSFKGVTVISSQRITITDLLVEYIGYEAIHLRSQTVDSEVTFTTIRKTGLVTKQFGEGVYLGTSDTNWCEYNGCQPDRTTRILVFGNTISETGAQAIEAKAGTSDGVIAANNLTGYSPGSSIGTEWVLVKGNDWLVADNWGADSPEHGYATNGSVSGWGKNNIFARNWATNTADYGTWIHLPDNVDLKNLVSCNNSVASAGDGATNVSCAK